MKQEGSEFSSQDKFLGMAAGIAMTSKCRFRHGCIVVKSGRVLAASPNIWRNNPLYVDWQHCSIHAEARALRKAGFPKRATVYVCRINRHGELRYSKPCDGCMSLIEELQCKVVHT